jgi:phage portal protein BeeE
MSDLWYFNGPPDAPSIPMTLPAEQTTALALAAAVEPPIRKARKIRPAAAAGASSSPVQTISQTLGVGVSNIEIIRSPQRLRTWAETTELVYAAINVIRDRVSSAEWQMKPIDQTKPYDTAFMQKMTDLFNHPNPTMESWRSFIAVIVEDICVLDTGSIEKEYALGGEVIGLWPVDGGKVGFNKYWDGQENVERYYYLPGGFGSKPIPMLNRELVVMQRNRASYRMTGLPPITVLARTIDSIVVSDQYQLEMAKQHPPSGMVLIPNLDQNQVDQIKSKYEMEVAGRKATFFLGYGTDGDGGRATYYPLIYNAQTMQWENWQELLIRKVAAVFGLSPQDLNLERDVNRSTAETQAQHTSDVGLYPMLQMIQGYLNREIVDSFPESATANVQFVFCALNDKDASLQAELAKTLTSGLSIITLNEARAMNGFEPLEGGDVILQPTATGAMPLLGDDAEVLRDLVLPAAPVAAPKGGTGMNDPSARAPSQKSLAESDPVMAGLYTQYWPEIADAWQRIAGTAARRFAAYLAEYPSGFGTDALRIELALNYAAQGVERDEIRAQMRGEGLGDAMVSASLAAAARTLNMQLHQLGHDGIDQLAHSVLINDIAYLARTNAKIALGTLAEDLCDLDYASESAARAGVGAWLDRQVDSRSMRLLRSQVGSVRQHALRTFVRMNGLTGTARLLPEAAQTGRCQQKIDAGWVPLATALAWHVPEHPNCVHYVETKLDQPERLRWTGGA